jgi:hypothetical protein
VFSIRFGLLGEDWAGVAGGRELDSGVASAFNEGKAAFIDTDDGVGSARREGAVWSRVCCLPPNDEITDKFIGCGLLPIWRQDLGFRSAGFSLEFSFRHLYFFFLQQRAPTLSVNLKVEA